MKANPLAVYVQALVNRCAKAGIENEAALKLIKNVQPVALTGEKGGKATLRIQGVFDDWFGFDAKAVIRDLDEMEPTDLTMLITSPGGSIFDANALYSDLRRRVANGMALRAEVQGVAASAAVMPLLAADERLVDEASQIMVHQVMGPLFAFGNRDDLKAAYDEIDKRLTAAQAVLDRVYPERTGQTAETVAGWFDTETWFDPEAAIEAGIATGMAEEKPDDPVDEISQEVVNLTAGMILNSMELRL